MAPRTRGATQRRCPPVPTRTRAARLKHQPRCQILLQTTAIPARAETALRISRALGGMAAMNKARALLSVFWLVWLWLACGVVMAAAQADFPSRPIRMIVPFPPGGGIDTTARITAQKLSEVLGQQIVIENQGGAGGAIATHAVAKAEPAGTTPP